MVRLRRVGREPPPATGPDRKAVGELAGLARSVTEGPIGCPDGVYCTRLANRWLTSAIPYKAIAIQ